VSAKGIDRLKVELCRLIKEAAQQGSIDGDEPLIILTSLIAKMISEVRDEKVRGGLTKAISTLLPEMVEMYTDNNLTLTIVEELLH
jgi:hypothetical protein